jgi:hypothetical protein
LQSAKIVNKAKIHRRASGFLERKAMTATLASRRLACQRKPIRGELLGVFIWLGGPMIALDEPTGRRLRERPFSPAHREAMEENRLALTSHIVQTPDEQVRELPHPDPEGSGQQGCSAEPHARHVPAVEPPAPSVEQTPA